MARLHGCPYRRPFGESFADCPAYEPQLFTPTTLRDVPMAPIWTCSHIGVAEDSEQRGRLYARCLIGDAAARREALFRKLRGRTAA